MRPRRGPEEAPKRPTSQHVGKNTKYDPRKEKLPETKKRKLHIQFGPLNTRDISGHILWKIRPAPSEPVAGENDMQMPVCAQRDPKMARNRGFANSAGKNTDNIEQGVPEMANKTGSENRGGEIPETLGQGGPAMAQQKRLLTIGVAKSPTHSHNGIPNMADNWAV